MPPKHLYCAQCGLELFHTPKALPRQGKIINVVEPHSCLDESTIPSEIDEEQRLANLSTKEELVPVEREAPIVTGTIFDKFKIVQKINDLMPDKSELTGAARGALMGAEVGDKRKGTNMREELLTSMAPQGVLDQVKGAVPGQYSEPEPEEESDE